MKRTTLVFLVLALLVPAAAVADPATDLATVYQDWRADGVITPCKFSRTQLASAQQAATPDLDAYAPGFRDAIAGEIRRHDTGGCTPAGPRPRSRLVVTAVRSRGGPAREKIRIANRGNASQRLKGWRLRSRGGNVIRLPSTFRLRPGRSLTITVGCLRGRRRGVVRGSRFYACRRKAFLRDRGDRVTLISASGRVISRKRG